MIKVIVRLTRIMCLCGIIMSAAPTYAIDTDDDPFSLNIEQNLAKPEVSEKHSIAVATAMGDFIRTLKQAGFDAKGVRKGEVAMVTIACRDLFAPNSTAIKESGRKILAKLTHYIKQTDNYKVVMAVHTDDTGDNIYAERITSDRVNAIDDFYAPAFGGESPIIPYGLGNDEPVAPNSGYANREKNRRVEIYFVPTKTFIDNARKKK